MLPSEVNFLTFSDDIASDITSDSFESLETLMLALNLPFTWTAIVTSSNCIKSSLYCGHEWYEMVWDCPNKLQNSSAMCGTNGLNIITNSSISFLETVLHFCKWLQ